jgi:hypothetical protein
VKEIKAVRRDPWFGVANDLSLVNHRSARQPKHIAGYLPNSMITEESG